MKRVMLTIWMALASIVNVVAQVNHYVFQDEKRGDMAYIYVYSEQYRKLSVDGKTTLLKAEADKFEVKSICIIDTYDVELWQMVDGKAVLLDRWGKNTVVTLPTNKKETHRRSLKHPWFFNLSGAFNYVSSSRIGETDNGRETLSYNLYSRFGCYLLKGRWDLALNGMIGYNKEIEDINGSNSNSIGVDTRLYILRGKAINPFAGVGIAYATSNGESSVTIPLSAGFSIPIAGKSCIDFCYQYNKVTKSAIILGYTYMHK